MHPCTLAYGRMQVCQAPDGKPPPRFLLENRRPHVTARLNTNPDMNHQEFVEAYRNGSLNMAMSQPVAARYLSRRLLLPLFMLPILGTGLALVLIGWFVTGVLVFLVGFIVPRLIKKNAIAILLYQALQDPQLYEDLRESGTMEIME